MGVRDTESRAGFGASQQALKALRADFPDRCIWQATREDGSEGAFYATTGRTFTDKDFDAGCIKTVFADTPEELRVLLAHQPDRAHVGDA